ncbi:MAG: hypothetical protein MZW92_60265 [Comamonadaceae bacterium]|nr:hypothetical protein [Comamonadaceae bacterium]
MTVDIRPAEMNHARLDATGRHDTDPRRHDAGAPARRQTETAVNDTRRIEKAEAPPRSRRKRSRRCLGPASTATATPSSRFALETARRIAGLARRFLPCPAARPAAAGAAVCRPPRKRWWTASPSAASPPASGRCSRASPKNAEPPDDARALPDLAPPAATPSHDDGSRPRQLRVALVCMPFSAAGPTVDPDRPDGGDPHASAGHAAETFHPNLELAATVAA